MGFIVAEMFLVAVLISAVTGAIFGATDDGALLYPLKHKLMTFGKAPELNQKYIEENHKLNKMYSDVNVDKEKLAIQVVKTRLADYKYKSYAKWRKPLLLCINCMPSFWGLILSPFFIYYGASVYSVPFGICLSSLINRGLSKTIF